jgi:hypothetical protein
VSHAYLDRLQAALGAALGETLRAVYLTGSAAVGAYRQGKSDLDVLVVADPAERMRLEAVVATCAHAVLPCPAEKLELVVYEPAVLAAPGSAPAWSLNFDTGRDTHQVDFDPATQPSHWFVLDLAFARRHAVALTGPPPAELIGDPGQDALLHAFEEQVAWYAANDTEEAAATAARRAAHWRATGEFAAKLDPGG